ncbi:restriction endonuclease subunit S [Algibacter luteus]|uniref:restriction endonuclease subunit S n=1 Tax=Algibacter luteus TaxID=1178825 RepID=UPI002598795E|nr:restriction endonuclease subunit S [Algibacter luteus]WJJ98233.1 restriction endonuclease subunit S [Algibacter luteus]
MTEGWKKIKLSEVAPYWTGKIEAELLNEHNFISADNMFPEKGGVEKSSYAPSSGKATSFKTKDILVSNIRPYFKKIWFANKNGGCSNDVIVFRTKLDLADPTFIYYYLSKDDFFDYMMAGANGTKMPRGNKKSIPQYEINLPPLKTQRKIASILSAYDDLIENNLKRIKLLEEQAQQTYEEWFSVSGVPVGWKEYALGDLIGYHIGGGWGQEVKEDDFPDQAYVIRGTDMDNLPLGSIENVPLRWHKKSNLKSRKLQDGDIVFEVSGGSTYEGVAKTLLVTDGLLKQFDSDVMCASFCKLMRPKTKDFSYALILFLKYLRKTKGTEIFEKRSASNIVNYNWEAFLKFQKVKMPEKEKLNKFNQKVEPIIKSVYILGNQITKLKEARDILLPRLMSGMIDPSASSGQVVDSLEVNAGLGMVAESSETYNNMNK